MYKCLVCVILAVILAGCAKPKVRAAYFAYTGIKKVAGFPYRINERRHLVPSEPKAEPADAGASEEDATGNS